RIRAPRPGDLSAGPDGNSLLNSYRPSYAERNRPRRPAPEEVPGSQLCAGPPGRGYFDEYGRSGPQASGRSRNHHQGLPSDRPEGLPRPQAKAEGPGPQAAAAHADRQNSSGV